MVQLDVIGRQNAKGELKYVSPNLDFNILNPIFLNNCNDMFSRNNLNINSDIYPKTSKSNQGKNILRSVEFRAKLSNIQSLIY